MQEEFFSQIENKITGKSVVGDRGFFPQERGCDSLSRYLPCSMTDYLKDYIGRSVQIDYLVPGGRFIKKQGVITAVGTDFIAILPKGSRCLFLLELSAVKSVNILDYQNR